MDDRVQQNQTQFDISVHLDKNYVNVLCTPWCGSEGILPLRIGAASTQALNFILRGVRIGADRVKITLFLRGAERVHVPTVLYYITLCRVILEYML